MVRLITVLLLAIGHVWLYFRVLRPLDVLAAQARRLSHGEFMALQSVRGEAGSVSAVRGAMTAMVGHVRRAQAQERTYMAALTNGQEGERSRIARELHDDTVQSLIAIAQSLEIAQGQLGTDAPAHALLGAAREQAVQSVHNLRRLIADLRPPILADLGLIPALTMLAESIPDVQVQVGVSGTVRRLDEAVELALYRNVQEAVQNARRHGRAERVDVQVAFGPDAIEVTVVDNGAGFTALPDVEQLAAEGHYGLLGMRERIEHLDGAIHVHSGPGQGTRVEMALPTRRSAQPAGVVRDPVCSALIVPDEAYSSVDHDGERYYFCCPVCEGAFRTDPALYLDGPAHRPPR